LVKGKVIETLYTASTSSSSSINVVCGVQLEDGTTIEADAVLYACGPWNIFHSSTTGDLHTSMYGVKYHSLVVPTSRVYTQCVFFHGGGDPEVYVRPDQTAYCTGYPEPARIVTELPGEEMIDRTKISNIYNAIEQVTRTDPTTTAVASADYSSNSSSIRTGLLLEKKDAFIEQACYLPSTEDGIPIMGPLLSPRQSQQDDDSKSPLSSEHRSDCGLYIATGHSCWGILLGPGTGECMASVIATGQSTKYVSLSAFDPYRFIH
jgi:glycine/D-amino acid oxidase-like deaminating enzyme